MVNGIQTGDARDATKRWRIQYNEVRPHSALVIEPRGSLPNNSKLSSPHTYLRRNFPAQINSNNGGEVVATSR